MRPVPIVRPRAADLWILAALSLVVAATVWIVFHRFTVDDAYIAYRHARNLARGFGPVMNPGERVEGVSNLPWTLLLGVLARVGFEPDRAGPWLSTLCGLACLVATALVARRWRGDWRTAGTAAVLCAAGLPLGIWSASGMETSAVALLLLALTASWMPSDPSAPRGPRVGTGIALGMLAILRPEGAMFALPVAWCSLRGDARGARSLAVAAAAAAAVVLPVVLFRRGYYGDWLPNPVYAKLPSGFAALAPGLAYVLQFAVAFPLALLAAARLAGEFRRDSFAALVVGIVAVQLGFALLVGGDHFPAYRFAAPLWPLLAIAMARELCAPRASHRAARGRYRVALAIAVLAAGLLAVPRVVLPLAERAATLQRLQRPPAAHTERLLLEIRHLGAVLLGIAAWGASEGRRRREPNGAWSAALPISVVLLTACLVTPAALDPRVRAAREPDAAARYGRPVGEWLGEHLPPGSRVATNAAGSLPYYSELPVIDMLGLTDRVIARGRPDSARWIGHERGNGRAVLDRRPAVIVFGGPEGSATPWPFRSDQEIAADPEFEREYVLERVPLADFEFVFYRRRDVELRGGEPAMGL